MKYLMSICLVALLLGGCATTREYEEKLSTWIGHSVAELYSKLGIPSSTQPQADGGSIVSYEQSEAVKVAPKSSTTAPERKPPQQSTAQDIAATNSAKESQTSRPGADETTTPSASTRTVSCTTRYRTDSTGVIRSWTFDGAGCKAHDEPYSQHR